MALNVRVQWLKRAIKSKELDAVDREYLSSHLAPVITELSKKQTPLANALNCLNELIAFRTLQLGHLQLSEEGLNFLKQKLERIKEVSTYRIED
ncbi:MAG: hypothetical protein IPN38_15505 [Flavobacteriales bacterium]|nr:hypothetical protein [Flavobacteriales bacterium]